MEVTEYIVQNNIRLNVYFLFGEKISLETQGMYTGSILVGYIEVKRLFIRNTRQSFLPLYEKFEIFFLYKYKVSSQINP